MGKKNQRDIRYSRYLKVLGRANRLAVWSLQRAQDELKTINDAVFINNIEAKEALENQMGSPNHRSDFPNIKITVCEDGRPKALVERDRRYCRRKRAEAASIVLLIVAVAVACCAYSSLSEEHPIESISLDYDGGTLYPGDELVTVEAGVPFTMEAVIAPSDATDKTLKWFSSLDGVQLTQNGSHLSILIGPAASTGDVLTMTARSTAYDKEASLSFKVSNNIALSFDKPSSAIGLGESITVSCTSNAPDLGIVPVWSIDSKKATLTPHGSSATVSVGYDVRKGETITLTATVPGTSISHSVVFTIGEEVRIDLDPIAGVIRNNDGTMTVHAGTRLSIRADVGPSDLPDRSVVWASNMKDTELVEDGTAISVLVGPSARTGDVLTLTAKSMAYGMESSLSFKVVNDIALTLAASSSSIGAGDTITVRCTYNAPDIHLVPTWSVDRDWATLAADGDSVSVTIGYGAPEGDRFTVTASIPGTDISQNKAFTVENGVAIELTSSTGSTVDVGVPFTVRAAFTPSGAPDKGVKWSSDLEGVTIDAAGGTATVMVPLSVGSGTILTVTAESTAYGAQSSMSFTVRNSITLSFDKRSSSVGLGESVTVTCQSSAPDLHSAPIWSIDSDLATLRTDGYTAAVTIGYAAQKGDTVTLTATVPGTPISQSVVFTVKEGLSVTLSASPRTVDAGSGFSFTATVLPCLPPGSSISWEVLGPEGGAYHDVATTESSGTLSGTLSSDADDGIVVTVRAILSGYGTSAESSFTTSNLQKVPVAVSDVKDLLSMRGSTRTFVLQNDIDMSTTEWTPFEFNGTLDGNGFSITGLTVKKSSKESSGIYYGGLFSINSGAVRDLVIEGASIWVAPDNRGAETTVYAGVVCGINNGMISRVDVRSSDVLAHSTNIRTLWLSEHDEVPKMAEPGKGLMWSGPWFDYATLTFTGTLVNNWKGGAPMSVYSGGIAGLNQGTISDSLSDAGIDAEVINFNADNYNPTYNLTDRNTYLLYVGGIAGSNSKSGDIASCNSSGDLIGLITLHDSGQSFGAGGNGTGNGWYDPYKPGATGCIGGIVGSSSGDVIEVCSSCSTITESEVYAPQLNGGTPAIYDRNKGDETNIVWHSGPLTGYAE